MPRKLRHSQISAWAIPLMYSAGALLFGLTVPRLANTLLPGFVSTISVNSAIGIYSAVASGMLSLTAIVFSLTFLVVQFSATAYSPRLVLFLARDPLLSHASGMFIATFLYALSALSWVDRAGNGRVPLIGVGVVVVLLVGSMMMFVSLIQRVGMLQVTQMLRFTGDQGREVIEGLYPPIEAIASPGSIEIPEKICQQILVHRGHPQTVQAVDVPALVHLASRAGCVIEMAAAIGDAVLDSTAILRVYGGQGPISEDRLRKALTLGNERTFEQDPKYAIRLLVDIAIKALSPAVNDPTTAVQALDQIEDLLIRLGRRRLEIGAYHDAAGKVRVLMAFPKWEDFLRLAFDEIRFYGANSVQVMRRMRALITELRTVLPEERRPAIDHWRTRLQSTVERSYVDWHDKLDASAEDRQGLGSPNVKAQSS
jgi:uncharacterized membrane protein